MRNLNVWRWVKRVASVIFVLLAPSASSLAQDATGLWADQPDACSTVFVKAGGRTEFSPKADFHGSGLIVEGNVIRGKMATCKIRKKVRKGQTVTLTATCATDVMVSTTTFQLKIDDPNTIVKIVPGIPELDTRYIRCPSK